MAALEPKQIILSEINNGQEYNDGDGVSGSSVTAAIEASAWAQDTASTANTNASQAVSTATAANTKSDNAITTANSANTTANAANTKSDTAMTDAATAVESSNQAVSTASQAVSTANTANSNATQAVNTSNSALAWAQALTDAPDLTEVGNVGTPSVSFVDNGEYKKFKFSNLKGNQGASVQDVDFIYNSETSTETVYDVKTTLDDDTVVNSGQVTIPKAAIPMISEFAQSEQDTPSADLMVGGFFFTEVTA